MRRLTISRGEMDKNKALFKLANFPPVLWINLDRFPDRKKIYGGAI